MKVGFFRLSYFFLLSYYMKNYFFFLILSISIYSFSQKTNYLDYHISINKAEELFFIEQKTDSALFYYDKAFKEYDFIFVKDLVNAAQIAIFSNKPYQKYIEKGFFYGLKLSHLNNFPLFNDVLSDLKSQKKTLKKYKIARKVYLSKIDFKYLDEVYKLAIIDQKEKRKKNYDSLIHNSTNKIIEITLKKGFPGEKTIGISDSLVFSEINTKNLDLFERIKNNPELSYMTSDEKSLSIKWPLILFIHNGCSYNLYENVFLNQIENGNMHPRDVALLYDNQYRYVNYFPNYCQNIKLNGVYRLNLFTDYINNTNIEETNLMRKKLHIVSTFVDEKKKEYETKYGFKMFTGFWNCR